jgi:hypothetical protein
VLLVVADRSNPDSGDSCNHEPKLSRNAYPPETIYSFVPPER